MKKKSRYLGDLYAESGQTLQGLFSALSKPNFASKYSLESSRRDLHNALLCTVLMGSVSNLNFFVKNRQKKIAIELMNFINSIAKNSKFAFFLRIFDEIFFRISRQIPENSDVCRFFNQICENTSEICRKF